MHMLTAILRGRTNFVDQYDRELIQLKQSSKLTPLSKPSACMRWLDDSKTKVHVMGDLLIDAEQTVRDYPQHDGLCVPTSVDKLTEVVRFMARSTSSFERLELDPKKQVIESFGVTVCLMSHMP
jgi:hypothetical protein